MLVCGALSDRIIFQRIILYGSGLWFFHTIAILMTCVLLIFYLYDKISIYMQILMGNMFFSIDLSFLVTHLTKLSKGGWISIFTE